MIWSDSQRLPSAQVLPPPCTLALSLLKIDFENPNGTIQLALSFNQNIVKLARVHENGFNLTEGDSVANLQRIAI